MSTKEKRNKLIDYCMSIPICEGCIGCKMYPHTRYGCVPAATTETDIEKLYEACFEVEE